MAIKTWSVLLLAGVIALSGCLNQGATDMREERAAPGGEELSATETSQEGASSTADATGTTPAPESANVSETPENATGARAPRTVTVEATSRVTLAVGMPCGPSAMDCSSGLFYTYAQFADIEASPIKAKLTATWTPSIALAEKLVVRLYGVDGFAVAKAEGTSPLILELPPEAISVAGTYAALGAPATGSAALNQEVAFSLTLEYA